MNFHFFNWNYCGVLNAQNKKGSTSRLNDIQLIGKIQKNVVRECCQFPKQSSNNHFKIQNKCIQLI
jgi:hypothetical protein